MNVDDNINVLIVLCIGNLVSNKDFCVFANTKTTTATTALY
jgi:hypothetical protein